jgi:hypothetical protein
MEPSRNVYHNNRLHRLLQVQEPLLVMDEYTACGKMWKRRKSILGRAVDARGITRIRIEPRGRRKKNRMKKNLAESERGGAMRWRHVERSVLRRPTAAADTERQTAGRAVTGGEV